MNCFEKVMLNMEKSVWSMPRGNRNWLVSYPRSGNTWVRLFMEYYTGKSTRSDKIPVEPLKVDTKETIMWKEHFLSDIKKDETDKFVFLIRSPFNTIPSKLKFDGKDFTDKNVLIEVIDYTNEIRDYEKINECNKHLIYYEDLLTHFKETVISMLLFLNLEINISKINRFMENDIKNYKTAYHWYLNDVPDKTMENLYATNDFNNRKSDLTEKQINIIRDKIKDIRYLRRYDGS